MNAKGTDNSRKLVFTPIKTDTTLDLGEKAGKLWL
uniref:Uncharacterized protein n=1 Tax=Peronospora matthiolae TaxID=2874970 RepID=A0AAV1TWS4_9STRA